MRTDETKPFAYRPRTWLGRKLLALASRLDGKARDLDPDAVPGLILPGREYPLTDDEASLATDDFKPKR